MQRLLRGRLLYVVLGLLVVGAYAVRLWLHPAPHHDVVPPVATEGSLEWWPTPLDLATVQAITERQPFLKAALGLMGVGLASLALGGVALLLWSLGTGRIRSVWRFPTHRLPSWSFGELARITLLVVFLAGLLPLMFLAVPAHAGGLGVDPHLRITVSMILLDGGAILAMVAFAAGKGSSWRDALGLSRGAIAPSMATGLRGYVAVFPWLFVVLFLTVAAMRSLGLKPPIEPMQKLIFQEDRPLVLGLTVLLACVIGPVAEELFFRGIVYTAIRRRTSWVVAVPLSGATFALLHGNLAGFPSILVLGCLLANLYERTGTLVASLGIHVLHNTLLMGTALLIRQLMVSAG